MGQYHFMRFPGGKTKAVTLSYDDAPRFDRRLIEIIKPYGLKCTFNIMSGYLGLPGHFTKEEAYALYADTPHEVAVHCYHHTAPGMTSYQMTGGEVMDDRRTLENLFHRIVNGMAYPDSGMLRMSDGKSEEDIKKLVSMLGIVYARTTKSQSDCERFMMPNDFLAWSPTCHHNEPKLSEYAEQFLQADVNSQYVSMQWPRLFYLWGHSYEFENNGNWSVLENFAKAVGNRDDVWYATNMEIYRYHKAYSSLVFSFDDNLVYNPSSMPVWFRKVRKDYCIAPGETVDCSADA